MKTWMAALSVAGLLIAAPIAAGAQTSAGETRAPAKLLATTNSAKGSAKMHRVVVQVTQNDPVLMNLALNNIDNLTRYYEDKNEGIEVELVAYGPGLHMMRSDTSPVKSRLSALVKSRKGVTLTGCANTMANHSKQDGREVSLVPEARIAPAGIARVVELQELGWVYVRP